MDAFEIAAIKKEANLQAVDTTHTVLVCKPWDLPEKQSTDSTNSIQKHIDSGICVMFHKGNGTILEVRGYDETGKEFSYKFLYEKDQSCAMRIVSGAGDVHKLAVSTQSLSHFPDKYVVTPQEA